MLEAYTMTWYQRAGAGLTNIEQHVTCNVRLPGHPHGDTLKG